MSYHEIHIYNCCCCNSTLLNDVIRTYNNFPSAGPDLRTSEMAMLGSPLVKWGLSRPPLTAMPNPYPGTRSKSTWWYSQTMRSPPCKIRKEQNYTDCLKPLDHVQLGPGYECAWNGPTKGMYVARKRGFRKFFPKHIWRRIFPLDPPMVISPDGVSLTSLMNSLIFSSNYLTLLLFNFHFRKFLFRLRLLLTSGLPTTIF